MEIAAVKQTEVKQKVKKRVSQNQKNTGNQVLQQKSHQGNKNQKPPPPL